MFDGFPLFGESCAVCGQTPIDDVASYQMIDGGTMTMAVCPECEAKYAEKLRKRGFKKQVTHAS